MIRRMVVGACLVVLVGACTQAGDTATTTTLPTATQNGSTSTTTAQAVTSTTMPPTTTTTYPRGLMVLSGPLDGAFVRDQIDYSLWGDVRPEAMVTVNDATTAIEGLAGETVWGPGWHRWRTAEDSVPDAILLNPGSNILSFRAVFANGEELIKERTVTFDPSLRRETGYMVGLTLSIPPTATVVYATLEEDEWGLYQEGEASPPTDLPIAPDAAFIVLDWLPPESRVRDLTEFAELAIDSIVEGEVSDAWFGQLFPAPGEELSWATAAPWEFLINESGQLQQATQLYTP